MVSCHVSIKSTLQQTKAVGLYINRLLIAHNLYRQSRRSTDISKSVFTNLSGKDHHLRSTKIINAFVIKPNSLYFLYMVDLGSNFERISTPDCFLAHYQLRKTSLVCSPTH
jgi:hypothetical protein